MKNASIIAVLMRRENNCFGWTKCRDLTKTTMRKYLQKKYRQDFKVLSMNEYEDWYNRNVAPYYVPQKNEE